jgi:hypothetical protein
MTDKITKTKTTNEVQANHDELKQKALLIGQEYAELAIKSFVWGFFQRLGNSGFSFIKLQTLKSKDNVIDFPKSKVI